MDDFSIKLYVTEHETIFLHPKNILLRPATLGLKFISNSLELFGLQIENWEIIDKMGDVIAQKVT